MQYLFSSQKHNKINCDFYSNTNFFNIRRFKNFHRNILYYVVLQTYFLWCVASLCSLSRRGLLLLATFHQSEMSKGWLATSDFGNDYQQVSCNRTICP